MTGRMVAMPLGDRTASAINAVKEVADVDVSLCGIQNSYELIMKTPHSSGSSCSSGSSINTDGSSASDALSDMLLSSSSAKSSAFSVTTATMDPSKTAPSSVQHTPQSSPLKIRSKVPTLDAIAARLRRGADLSHDTMRGSHSSTEFDQENAVNASTNAKQSHRGRSEAIASLVHRTSNRSQSTSPIKKSFDDVHAVRPSAGRAALSSMNIRTSPSKEVPTLQDIIKRIGNKKGAESATSSPDLSVASTVLPSTPTRSKATSGKEDVVAEACDAAAKASTFDATSTSNKVMRSVASSPAPVKVNVAPPKLALPKPDEHPLEHVWSLFFDSKTWNPSSGEQQPKSPVPTASLENARTWEATLKLLGKYNTVESFMTVFRTLRRPSQLERNSNYHLFKDGIKPMWEDPANVDGGKWIITLRAGNAALLDRSWMWLVLALIGEDLDEDNDITGAVVSTRAKGDRIALWVRNKNNVQLVNKIGRRFASLMDLEREPGVSLEFTSNHRDGDTSAHLNGAFATTQYYSFHNGMPTPTQVRSGKLTGSTSCSGQALLIGNPSVKPADRSSSINAPASPLQSHGTLGAHLRLHGSPSKLSSSSSSTAALIHRSPFKTTLPSSHSARDLRRSDSDSNLTTGAFAMGVGTTIGRTNNSSPAPPSRTSASGLMNRTKF